jgi:hypothetical protein
MRRIIDEKSKDGIGARLSKSLAFQLEGCARINLFVACFSEVPDLLSQWRAYCPNGNGYSMGFSYGQLKKQMSVQQFFLTPCVYQVTKQERLIRELVDGAFEVALQAEKPDIETIAKDCIGKFQIVGPALKHPTFAEEAEWRLVSKWPKVIQDPRIMVREGKSILLPYFQFNLEGENGILPRPRIFVGPNPHMELAILSVKFLMKSFGANVQRTTIPYRGW